ncbi:hypothetical protein SEA_LESNORAH_11 [Microbacterium phage LesNorah]|nr:hypothetical protein SEA_BLUERUGRAT_11 [Microbacterium phage BlueRugrat]UQS94777.1 hypothetical protein SEA_LESNORAH_11 [Microbacterium phage LesNorah]
MSKTYTNPQFTRYTRMTEALWHYYNITSDVRGVRMGPDPETGKGEMIEEEVIEFTVDEWPGKIFGIWSEEACWVREEGQPVDIQYGYSNHGPYWEEDPNIFWDVLEPEGSEDERRALIEAVPVGDLDEFDKKIGLSEGRDKLEAELDKAFGRSEND